MIVLIPAYEPDHRLTDVITDLGRELPDAELLVVDDGSGPAYEAVFADVAAAGATVIGFPANRGKGAALRSGFAWVMENRPGAEVVCADSDGQHLAGDIARVAAAVRPRTMVLGGRRFAGTVPARSRFGNTVTRYVFRVVSGSDVHDTQTGLRAYAHDLLPWLVSVPGDRFEYELNLLLAARGEGIEIVEIEIQTVYHPTEHTSHFRTFADSYRVYAPMVAHIGTRVRRGLRRTLG